MVEEVFEDCPELPRRCRDLCAGRGLDSGPLKAKLWQDYQIRPLIEPRELWREEKAMPDYDPALPVTRALYPERADTIVYTEKGQVQCRCPKSGEVRDLAFWGFESDRNTLKYRCPAAAHDLQCAGREACERSAGGHVGEYGRIVRIDLDAHDRRIFTPTPYGSPSWKRGYNRRSALERINNRLDHAFEFEQHFIHPGTGPDAHPRRGGAGGDDGAGVGAPARRSARVDALAVRRGSLRRHRLSAPALDPTRPDGLLGEPGGRSGARRGAGVEIALVAAKPAFGASQSAGQAPGGPHWAPPPARPSAAHHSPPSKLPHSAHPSTWLGVAMSLTGTVQSPRIFGESVHVLHGQGER